MSTMYAIARSSYTQAALWAIVVEDSGAYEVLRPNGDRNEDQERRIARLYEIARTKPSTPDGVIRLASLNMSAVNVSFPTPAESTEDARSRALAALA